MRICGSSRFRHLVCVSACFIGLIGIANSEAASLQDQVTSVGVLAFRDESGLNLPAEFGQRATASLQQKVNATYKDMLARPLGASAETSSLTVEQLAALGKQNGVKFVVRGGVLDLAFVNTGEGVKATVQLYADVLSVDTLTMRSVRAEGTGAQGGTDREAATQLSAADFRSAEFLSSALGQALSSSVEQLAARIYQAAGSSQPEIQTGPDQTPDAVQAEADEELQQLVAQAEGLLSSGSALTSEHLNSLSQALEGLKAAVTSKAALLEQLQDTTQADQEIAARKQELQLLTSAISEQISAGDAVSNETGQTSGERKNLLAVVGEYVGETLNILQKIQEMRATLRAASEDPTYVQETQPETAGQPSTPTEEPVEEVSGVVTEEGSPVEGVTVTDVESGETATTDSNGSYTLENIPAGKPSKLTLSRRGKQLATALVAMSRGRAAVADFELKSKSTAASTPALRIVPSTVALAARGGTTGALKGVVRDGQGRPVARALVSLKGLAVARTDSQGRYVFLNVPEGIHELSVHKSGLKLKSERVQVAAKKSSESRIQFASTDRGLKAPNVLPMIVRGAGTVLRGLVFDGDKRPIAGTKVTMMQPTGAVSLLTGSSGDYEFRDLRPGSYKVVASKVGYDGDAQIVNLRAGRSEARNFQLRKKLSPFVQRAIETQRIRRTGSEEKKPHEIVQVRNGQVRGRVMDAKTRRPIAGATISISGQRAITTNQEGLYLAANLGPGSYRIRAAKAGFSEGEAAVTLSPGETAMANFALNPKVTPTIRLRTAPRPGPSRLPPM